MDVLSIVNVISLEIQNKAATISSLDLRTSYYKLLKYDNMYLILFIILFGSIYSRLTCPHTDYITTDQLLDSKATLPLNNYGVSSIGIMLSHPSLLLNKNPKRVNKFYRKQSDLMENFKRDSTAIEVRFLISINFLTLILNIGFSIHSKKHTKILSEIFTILSMI